MGKKSAGSKMQWMDTNGEVVKKNSTIPVIHDIHIQENKLKESEKMLLHAHRENQKYSP